MKSSLTYQLVLYLGAYYFFCYEVLELLLLLYKAILLPYPTGVLFSEVEFFSFELTSRGNVDYVSEEHESYGHVELLTISLSPQGALRPPSRRCGSRETAEWLERQPHRKPRCQLADRPT